MISLNNFRRIFLYEFKLNQSVAETARKINHALAMIVLINKLFEVGLRNFVSEGEPRSGRPTVIQDGDLRTLVETDPSQTVRGMAEELGVSSLTIFVGLKHNGKVK